jgi:hypothetical protein
VSIPHVLTRHGARAFCQRRGVVAALALTLPFVVAACHVDRLFGAGDGRPDGDVDSEESVATRLVFIQQPATSTARREIAPPPVVAVLDQFGETHDDYDGTVTLKLKPGSGRLVGATSRPASDGVAVFNDIGVERTGRNYRLEAHADGLESATSAAFDVMESDDGDDPDAVAMRSGNAQSDTAGGTLSNPYVVRVTSESGAPVANISVRWTVQAGGGSVTPVVSVTDNDGEAESRHTLGTVAGVQMVNAEVDGVSDVVVFTANARHASPASLVFAQQPTDTRPGRNITPPVQVRLEDRFGNIATGFDDEVTVRIAPLTGTPGAALSGRTSRKPDDGIVTFSGLSIFLPGLGYRLLAQSSGLHVLSAAFNVL